MVKAETYVEIRATILNIGERAAGIPDDTAAVPLVMWLKGHLMHDCILGETATVKTATERMETGILESVEPVTQLDYGQFVPELLEIRRLIYG